MGKGGVLIGAGLLLFVGVRDRFWVRRDVCVISLVNGGRGG